MMALEGLLGVDGVEKLGPTGNPDFGVLTFTHVKPPASLPRLNDQSGSLREHPFLTIFAKLPTSFAIRYHRRCRLRHRRSNKLRLNRSSLKVSLCSPLSAYA